MQIDFVCLFVCVRVYSSYLHCEWATEQQLVKDKRIQQKIKRFKIKQAQRAHFFADVSVSLWICTLSSSFTDFILFLVFFPFVPFTAKCCYVTVHSIPGSAVCGGNLQ